jgi:two-component sensor histidine kinase
VHDNIDIDRGRALRRTAAPAARFSGERILAQSITDGLGQPLLVLDVDGRVVVANASFCKTFGTEQRNLGGQSADAIRRGQPAGSDLRALLDWVLIDGDVERVDRERSFAGLGRRRVTSSGLTVFHDGMAHKMVLIALDDATGARLAEAALEAAMHQNAMLLQEIQHRVGNSLQIIASILLLKAHSVESLETRLHLQDAHHRVIAIAAAQEQLAAVDHGAKVAVGPYLTKLCGTLAGSLIEDQRIVVTVDAAAGEVEAHDAASLGLFVTELLINAVKHAFPAGRQGSISVDYESHGDGWTLSVSDNGVGLRPRSSATTPAGLGSSVVEALARQLHARVETVSDGQGTSVSIRRQASRQ